MIRVKKAEREVLLNLVHTLREIQARQLYSERGMACGAQAIADQMPALERTEFWRELNADLQAEPCAFEWSRFRRAS